MTEINQKTVRLFKALGDENRFRILECLKDGEKCACVLLNKLDISQPTLSHHMKLLCDAGIVIPRKEGKWTHYSIDSVQMQAAANTLTALLQTSSDILPECSCPAVSADAGTDTNLQTILHNEGDLTMNEKTRLYVLTGFLGSGKTTILLKLLETLKGKRVGVIQNEFGKLSIDGTILKNDDIQMVEINRGSIFCSCLKLSFVQALADMSAHDFDYLFVESSGLGDPSNVEEILEAASSIAGDRYDFKGVICLVDSLNFFDQLGDLETVYRQLKHCHLAVLTKVDLIDGERLLALKAKIREINPVCRIETSAHASLDLSFLSEDLLQYQWAEKEASTNTPETKPKSLFLNFTGSIPKEKLEHFLTAIQPDVYRIKGFFQLEGLGWHQVDVAGKQIEYQPCEPKEISQIVFISKIGPALIKKIFSAWEEQVGLEMQLKN